MVQSIKNDTDKTVYIKVGEDSMALEPGQIFSGDIDGVWLPERPNEVYKIPEPFDATVKPGGNVDPYGPDVLSDALGGGWKGEDFFTKDHPDWKPFVDQSKASHAKKKPMAGSGNGKLIQPSIPEDRIRISADHLNFIIDMLLEIKGEAAANRIRMERLEELAGAELKKKC